MSQSRGSTTTRPRRRRNLRLLQQDDKNNNDNNDKNNNNDKDNVNKDATLPPTAGPTTQMPTANPTAKPTASPTQRPTVPPTTVPPTLAPIPSPTLGDVVPAPTASPVTPTEEEGTTSGGTGDNTSTNNDSVNSAFIQGHLALSLSLYIPTPKGRTLDFTKMEAPMVEWMTDFVCQARQTRLIVQVDSTLQDTCRYNPLPLPASANDLILVDQISIMYSSHEWTEADASSSSNQDNDDIAVYTRWTFEYPIYQWGYYQENKDQSIVDSSFQSALDKRISNKELNLPWESAQASVIGHELYTFEIYDNSLEQSSSSTLEDPFHPYSLESWAIQGVGVFMMLSNALVAVVMTHYGGVNRRRRNRLRREQQLQQQQQQQDPSTSFSGSAQSSWQRQQDGLEAMLGATREIVVPQNTTMSSMGQDDGSTEISLEDALHIQQQQLSDAASNASGPRSNVHQTPYKYNDRMISYVNSNNGSVSSRRSSRSSTLSTSDDNDKNNKAKKKDLLYHPIEYNNRLLSYDKEQPSGNYVNDDDESVEEDLLFCPTVSF